SSRSSAARPLRCSPCANNSTPSETNAADGACRSRSPRPQAQIHLQFLAGRTLHPPERQLLLAHQPHHEAAHRKITDGKLPLDDQVLINPLDRQALRQRLLDLFTPWLAQAGWTATAARAGLRVGGGFWRW